MSNALEPLLAEGIISEVVGRLQSGKEAEVFIVRYGEQVVAAKVYKDRGHRSFKNNSSYKEGREVRNSRDQRAMNRGSKFGKGAEEDAWKSAEVDAMYKLHAADVRVPAPVLFFEGVLLMELVLDADGNTARRLIDSALTVEEANAAYHDMLRQLVRMLSCDLIHGDLSPYNVLWAASGATIIDFPQIVSASHNSNSERFFLRDAGNILGFFAELDPSLKARRSDAAEIWRAYMRRELSADFVPTGHFRPPPAQRALPIQAPRVPGADQRYGNPRPQAPRGVPERPQNFSRGQQAGAPRGFGSQPRGQGQQAGGSEQQPPYHPSAAQGRSPQAPRQGQGQPRQGQGQPRQGQGQPRQGQGQPRQGQGQPRQGQGQPRQGQGQPRQGQGQGQPRHGQGAPQGRPGRPRQPDRGAGNDRRPAARMPEVIVRPRAALAAPEAAPPPPRPEPRASVPPRAAPVRRNVRSEPTETPAQTTEPRSRKAR